MMRKRPRQLILLGLLSFAVSVFAVSVSKHPVLGQEISCSIIPSFLDE